jgi:ATP-dependent DNA helicase RecG
MVSISSILNKNGNGTIYFGVANNGDIIGHQIGESTLRDISQAISYHIEPKIVPTIAVEFYDNLSVIKVTFSGIEQPYSAYGKFYVRMADEDRLLSRNQLSHYFTSPFDYDYLVKTISLRQDLSFFQAKALFASRKLTLSDETFYKNLNLLTQEGKFNRLAQLISDNSNESIKVARFKGKDKVEMVLRNEYGYKCLFLSFDQSLQYVDALNETRVNLHNATGIREEERLFDSDSFREAWLNAIVHNKWSENTPPAVYIYDDRIEIISTGGLPQNYSRDEFFAGTSRPVNPELQKIFGQLDYVEQTGHGVPVIVKKYGKEAFLISDNFIIVRIPFKRQLFSSINTDIENKNLNKSQQAVFNEVSKNSNIRISTLASNTGLSEDSIKKILAILKKEKLIERIGNNRNGHWRIF